MCVIHINALFINNEMNTAFMLPLHYRTHLWQERSLLTVCYFSIIYKATQIHMHIKDIKTSLVTTVHITVPKYKDMNRWIFHVMSLLCVLCFTQPVFSNYQMGACDWVDKASDSRLGSLDTKLMMMVICAWYNLQKKWRLLCWWEKIIHVQVQNSL